MKKIALILSGCGQHDGSETHEVILTLLSLAQENIEWQAFAPDIESTVINHLNEKPTSEFRSVLAESARLVRGKIQPLSELNTNEIDGIIFPGGLGAVTVLCDWFEKKSDFKFQEKLSPVIEQAVGLRLPMGFICIAPMMVTKIYPNATFTIGNDKHLAEEIEAMGSRHIDCKANEVVVDLENKIVSTPANMVAKEIDEVYEGIKKLVQTMKQLMN